MSNKNTLYQKLKNLVSEKLEELFASIVSERKAHYLENPDDKPTPKTIKKVIEGYANTNASIAGGAGLLPGPLGMTAALPQITLVLRNQLKMIYDVGIAHGKEKMLSKELIMAVFASYLGGKGAEMVLIEGSKVLMTETSVSLFQRLITLAGAEVSEQLLKSSILSYLPVAGAVAIAAWSKYSTSKLGHYAISVFEKKIEVITEAASPIEPSQIVPEASLPSPKPDEKLLEELKFKILCNLVRMDVNCDERELAHVEKMIELAELPAKTKLSLAKSLKLPASQAPEELDLSPFKEQIAALTGLVVDMIALSKIDEKTPLEERLYIQQISEELGMSTQELNALMA